MATDDDSGGLGGLLSPSKLASMAAQAKLMGKQSVVPMIQRSVRDELVRLLNEHDPDELRKYIDVGYPMLREELPQGYKNAFSTLGPQFEDQIYQTVNPETVKSWLNNPDEWMGDDADAETVEEVREIGRILDEYPGGEQWLEQQLVDFYDLCDIIE